MKNSIKEREVFTDEHNQLADRLRAIWLGYEPAKPFDSLTEVKKNDWRRLAKRVTMIRALRGLP